MTVVTADVTAAKLGERSLVLSDGQTLTGSHVVMAAGARPNFFGVPGAAEHAFPLYSVADAERLRQHLQQLLQQAMAGDGGGEPGTLDVVVVGGGPTGVETTGALAELMHALATTGRLERPGQITIVDRGQALLAPFSSKAHEYSHRKLTEAGAVVKLGGGRHRSPSPIGSSSTTAARSRLGPSCGVAASPARPLRRTLGRSPGRGGRLDVRPGPDRRGLPRRLRGGRRREHPVR